MCTRTWEQGRKERVWPGHPPKLPHRTLHLLPCAHSRGQVSPLSYSHRQSPFGIGDMPTTKITQFPKPRNLLCGLQGRLGRNNKNLRRNKRTRRRVARPTISLQCPTKRKSSKWCKMSTCPRCNPPKKNCKTLWQRAGENFHPKGIQTMDTISPPSTILNESLNSDVNKKDQ